MTPQHPQRRTIIGTPRKTAIAALTGVAPLTAAPQARAVDGCLVLLCFAAPRWRAIPQCVPPVRQVLRDLALGKVLPTCGMSGPGNTADHTRAAAPSFCPPQYTRTIEGESQASYTCDFAGAVSVSMNGVSCRTRSPNGPHQVHLKQGHKPPSISPNAKLSDADREMLGYPFDTHDAT